MAQEAVLNSQDFVNLTDAILPSKSYFNTWNPSHVRVVPDTPSATLGMNTLAPPIENGVAILDDSGIPMLFSDAGLSHSPAFSTNSLHQLIATSCKQEKGNDMARTLKVQNSPYAARGLAPMTPEKNTQPTTTQDPLTTLKMRAKESVMAKRAQSIRSASRESRTVGTEVSAENLTLEKGNKGASQVGQSESQSRQVNNTTNDPSPESGENQGGSIRAPAEAMSDQLENLLAEGRAAASLGDNGKGSPNTLQAQQYVPPGTQQQQQERPGLDSQYLRQERADHKPEANADHPMAKSLQIFPSSEIDEIDLWLTMTGYYDKAYRDKVLSRRKRLKEIEEEKLRLLEEEQADQLLRGHLYHNNTNILTSRRAIRTASRVHRTPPPTNQDVGLRARESAFKPEAVPDEIKVTADTSKKRRMDHEATDGKLDRTTKIARTESHQRSPSVSHRRSSGVLRRSSMSERVGTNASTVALRPQSPENRDVSDRLGRENQGDYHGPWRRSQEQEWRSLDSRGRPGLRHDSGVSISYTQKLDWRAGNVRFFLLKSWNYENIMTAQRECTWATQIKNEELFVEAFKSCRHVIFIFSANHSKAFQGYARMEGLPDERGVEPPSWLKNLHWPTTGPFRIKWIVKGEIPYRAVGNLKNPLNENLPIFVGRDGQEIPEELGDELCDIIDEENAPRAHFSR